MKHTQKITKELINNRFYYKDGSLYYKTSTGKRPFLGKRAGTIHPDGGMVLQMNGRKLKEHRLIWVLFNGDIPENKEIDHIDGDRLNNHIENLRLATKSENSCNRRMQKNNKSGYKGVFLNANGRWASQIGINKEYTFIGTFDTKELAAQAYNEYAKKLHGEFAKQNILPTKIP